jgi:hypothetical protein
MPSGQPGLSASLGYRRISGKPPLLGRIDRQFPVQYKPQARSRAGS